MKRLRKTARTKKDNAEQLRRERDQALAFQAATDEILTAISRSTSDAKPVFEAIVNSVPRLFDTRYVAVFLTKGEELHLAAAKADARFGKQRAAVVRQFRDSFPQPIDWSGFTASALRSGKVAQIGPIIGNPKASPHAVKMAEEFGYNTMLVAPLMRGGKAIGVIGTTRPGVKLFSAKELSLFKAFAAQAVIAMENARLFNETKEALEQQTATAEILKVISGSPTATQPVFESIVQKCHALYQDSRVALRLIDHGQLITRASTGDAFEPMPIDRESGLGACVLERRTIHVPDLEAAAERYPRLRELGIKHGYRSGMFAPLMREGAALGGISVLRRAAGAFSEKDVALLATFADQAVIAIENARLFNETKEALDRQTATAEILRVIASSPTDVQPVLDAIAERAAVLCGAPNANVLLKDGDVLRTLAGFYRDIGGEAPDRTTTVPLRRGTVNGRAFVDRKVVHHADALPLLDTEYPESRDLVRRFGIRSQLVVPLVREGDALGTISIWRREARPFSDDELALVQTFADQAVIAIENARLFNETREALERQTAISDILRVISGSPADVKPVLETVAAHAARICHAQTADIVLADGCSLRVVASVGDAGRVLGQELPLDRSSVSGRSILDRAPVHMADMQQAGDDLALGRELARKYGFRTILGVPLLREDRALGAIMVRRAEVRPLEDKHVALLKTFADQAAIAIENARLFNETKEALERQTATAEILRVISGTPADTQPVFDAIVSSAQRLLSGKSAALILRRESEFFVSAFSAPGLQQAPADLRTVPLDREKNFPSRAILDGEVVHIVDWEADEVPEHERKVAKALGFASGVLVPLLREGVGFGALVVTRQTKGRFQEKEIALLRSFADQAAIAIENVRLFNETKEALEQQTASSEILRVISRTPGDVQPVFDSIVNNCGALFKDSRVGLWQIGEGKLFPRASTGYMPEPIPLDAESAIGACVVESRTIHLPDLRSGAEQYPRVRQLGLKHGYLSGVYAPLLREGHAVGGISVLRRELGAFSDKEVALLGTFASQAVIAIENARLFNETKEALEQQTATTNILHVISRSVTDLAPVFEAILENAVTLCEGNVAALWQYDGNQLCFAAGKRVSPEATAHYRSHPLALGTYNPTPQAALEKRTLHVLDVFAEPTYRPLIPRETFTSGPHAPTVLAVPLLRENDLLGVVTIWRYQKRLFTDKQVAMVNTFAAQAVIAIENVRLFNETKEAFERQKASAEILGTISSSIADTEPVFEKILESCERLFAGRTVGINVLGDDGMIHLGAYRGAGREAFEKVFPLPVDANSGSGLAIVERRVVHIPDSEADGVPEAARRGNRARGNRASLYAPMMSRDRAIGVIWVARELPGPFSETEIGLLKTFADQAVIAIENARLFNETKEALEQQTATAEILKVISESPTDVQPVFDAIAGSALRIFGGMDVGVGFVDGDAIQIRAGTISGPGKATAPRIPLNRDTYAGRAVLDGTEFNVADTEAPGTPPLTRERARLAGWRAIALVPMLREGVPIGHISVHRAEPVALDDKQFALLRTFAAQAVIAIENVRLFNETKEALERQTATAEILKVMSASLTDVQPVFDAVALNAARVCGVDDVAILQTEGANLRRVSHYGNVPVSPDSLVPVPPGSVNERVLSDHRTLHIPDTLTPSFTREFPGSQFPAMGVRALLATPLVRDGVAVGVIHLRRSEARPFTDKQIAMLETFADQAVIAIENVRLFKELQERTEALTKSVGQLTALGEVGQAIGSTLELDEVLRTIVQRAVELAGMDAGSIYEYNASERRFYLRAAQNVAEDILRVYRDTPLRLGEGAIGRAGATREPVMIEEVLNETYRSRAREGLIKSGVRSLLAVPLLREDLLLGAIVVSRKTPGRFEREVIELLKTFATQSAVAIQNARLFRELAQKSRELEEASRHKSQFLASMSHELRTPLNAILGFNEMILGQVYGEVPPDMKEPLEDIQKSGKHLLRLINNVLDLAKIEAGRMELALGDYSVQDTVESVRSTLRPLAEAKGLELVVSVPQDIPLAYGDGGRLTQCLMNLAGNSLKFTKEGRVEIAVEAENGHLRWRVSDTGIGIPPDKLPTLFSEFRQTDATIASEYGGTGLGLSITKKFVEMHGGRIWVESEPGKGSVFTVEIPLRVGAPT